MSVDQCPVGASGQKSTVLHLVWPCWVQATVEVKAFRPQMASDFFSSSCSFLEVGLHPSLPALVVKQSCREVFELGDDNDALHATG